MLTEQQLEKFAKDVMEKGLYELSSEDEFRVDDVFPTNKDALITIGKRKFAITMNNEGKLLIAGQGAVSEAVFKSHGVWKLTQDAKIYEQDVLEYWRLHG